MCSEKSPQPLLHEYRSPYDLTKRMGEDLVLNYNSVDLQTVSLRVGGIISNNNDTITQYFRPPIFFRFIVNPDIFRPIGLYGTLQAQICRCNRKDGEFQFIIGFDMTPNGRRINSLTIKMT